MIKEGIEVELESSKGKSIQCVIGNILADSGGFWEMEIINRDTKELVFTMRRSLRDE